MGLGDTLRAARERRGLTLEQASEDTRIRLKFLRALEAGDYQALPGATYTRGFLRNYGEYLDLDPDELVALYQRERGGPEPPQRLEPMRPITGRGALVLTPSLAIPLVVAAAVVLFVGYLYWQFVSFAVPPRLEIAEPPGDAVVQQAEFTLRGRTVPDGKLSVTIFPGPERYAGIRPGSDGSFAIPIRLRPGSNHLEVEVLDAAGKVNAVTRVIRYEAAAATAPTVPAAPQLSIGQPANGATYTDGPVTVSGRVESVATLIVNGVAVKPEPDGRFSTTILFERGQQIVRVVGRSASGAEVQEDRSVNVVYTRAVVQVRVQGGNAWLLAVIDGAQDGRTNRVYPEGATLSFSGKQVLLRTGNAGATYVNVNGRDLGALGRAGEVVERTFSLP